MLCGLSFVVVTLILLFPLTSFAKVSVLADNELAGVVAGEFSSFTIENGVARAEFNILTSTWAEIGSLKLGYYNDGTTTGWDEDWTNVAIGSQANNLTVSGFYIEAAFLNDITNPETRTLQSIKFGTTDMTGAITANFNSFSGDIAAGSPIDGHRLVPSFTSISFTNTGFNISLTIDGVEKGYQVHWDNATTN
jgi:hypothetical protein